MLTRSARAIEEPSLDFSELSANPKIHGPHFRLEQTIAQVQALAGKNIWFQRQVWYTRDRIGPQIQFGRWNLQSNLGCLRKLTEGDAHRTRQKKRVHLRLATENPCCDGQSQLDYLMLDLMQIAFAFRDKPLNQRAKLFLVTFFLFKAHRGRRLVLRLASFFVSPLPSCVEFLL
jgi:hypothetical protein